MRSGRGICRGEQVRSIETTGIQELLYQNFEHPRWDNVAARCLTCGNCTMVCPTCFCTNVEDVSDVTGDHAERWRRWDSCFTRVFLTSTAEVCGPPPSRATASG